MKMQKTMIMAILFTVGTFGAFVPLSADAAFAVSAVSASSKLTPDTDTEKASDGTDDTMWHSAKGDTDPWIILSVGGLYAVNKVVLHVHTSRTVSATNTISIYGSSTDTNDASFTLIKQVNGTGSPIETIIFDEVKVKYLKIKSKGDGEFLGLSEVQVFQPTFSPAGYSASSRLTPNHGPEKASDGTDDTMWHSAKGDTDPWIILYVGGLYAVNKVVLHVHPSRTISAANTISIYGSSTDTNDASFKLIKQVNGTQSPIETISFDDTKVKYLKIKSKGDGEFLGLSEVQVFPDSKTNVTGPADKKD